MLTKLLVIIFRFKLQKTTHHATWNTIVYAELFVVKHRAKMITI
jgi:hypothetical protein